MKNKIGIRREDKNPWERRVPLIPSHVREIILEKAIDIDIQSSTTRIFPDEIFAREGAKIVDSLQGCPIVFAVKEIPLHFFEKYGVYIFFSHTIKGQIANMPMLKKMIELECTLIDYERITDDRDRRLLFFGNQAGQAGMIDTLWALGQRWGVQGLANPFSSLKQAFKYPNLVAAKEDIAAVGRAVKNLGIDSPLVPVICGFAGYGHVSKGAQKILEHLPVENLDPGEILSFFKTGKFASDRIYKVVFKEEHMVEPLNKEHVFDLQEYYDHPGKYRSIFEKYLPYLTSLVNGIFWNPQYPRLVTNRFLKQLWSGKKSLPRLAVIGDISCDVEGAIESTLKATTQAQPVFVFDPLEETATDGFKGRGVAIMAVDNLPAEIPLESSVFFSRALKPFVHAIAQADYSVSFDTFDMPLPVKKAVILYRGEFTPDYRYMEEFIKGE